MEFNLGIAEMMIVKKPNTLKTILGSCVGLCLWDKEKQTMGVVHIMLPCKRKETTGDEAKYADTAVGTLVRELLKAGIKTEKLTAKIAGGASMFSKIMPSTSINIGQQNYETVMKKLQELNIPVIAKDIGGENGRRLVCNPENGNVAIRIIGQKNKKPDLII